MTTPVPDPVVAVYRLDVILGSCAAVMVALLGCCGVLAKKSRRARIRLWCLSLSWGSVPPSPAEATRPPAPFARRNDTLRADVTAI